MATATSAAFIDFKKLGQEYYKLRQAERDKIVKYTPRINTLHAQPQPSRDDTLNNITVDLRQIRLEVKDSSDAIWKQDCKDVKTLQRTKNLRYRNPKGEDGVYAHVKNTPDMNDCFTVVITKGRCEEFGKKLYLPLPPEVHEAFGSQWEISPGKEVIEEVKKNHLQQTLGLEMVPKEATAVVESQEKRYTDTFSCKVYPEGKIMIGTSMNPKIQKVIGKLYDHADRSINGLVKMFKYVQGDVKGQSKSSANKDITQQSKYEGDVSDRRIFYWTLEGQGDFRWGSEQTMYWKSEETKEDEFLDTSSLEDSAVENELY